jgi:hypothetical protein
MVGKEVVSTAANVSAGAETAKVAPIVGAFAIGGLTPFEWAYTLAAVYSALLIVHLVMGKWVIPLIRFIRTRHLGKSEAPEGSN